MLIKLSRSKSSDDLIFLDEKFNLKTLAAAEDLDLDSLITIESSK